MKNFLLRAIRLFLSVVLVCITSHHATGQMREIYSNTSGDNNEIQKISFYSPSSGFIASTDFSSDWVGFTSDSGRTINKRYITLGNVNYNNYSVNLTFGFSIKGVKAFNQDTVVVWGDYGWVPAILYSTNGGQSYLLVYHSQYDPWQLSGGITDIVFPQNNNTGYAIDADRILKTTNSGQTWSVVSVSPGSYYHFLEAVDNNTVFAFSTDYNGSKLVKTTNGGQNWTQVITPQNKQIFYSTFRTALNGWLNVRDNNDSLRLYYTTNGGQSWVLKNHPLATPFFTYKMNFVNDSTGYSIGYGFNTYKTTDSGKVWQPLPRDNNFEYLGYGHNELFTYNETQLWCGGMKNFLEISSNGGGQPIPKAYFLIDTAGVASTNTVKLINYSKPGYQYKWIVNNNQVSANYNAIYTHNVFSPADSVELIVTANGISDTLKRFQYFLVPDLPSITSFTPANGSDGTYVVISGTNFTGVTSVKFGATAASSFTIVNNTTITAIAGAGATGPVTVSNNFGGFSLPQFTYFAAPTANAPIISSFFPDNGLTGTTITINGTAFGASPSTNIVYFGATKAAITTASSTQITCIVPLGASFEPISVLNTSTHLTGRSLKPFAVLFADSSNFTPYSYRDAVTLTYVNSPKHVAGKDLDDDGKPDLIAVVGATGGDSIIAYRNTTDGTNFSFGPRKNIGIIPIYTAGMFDVNDLDGDGKPDIACITNDQTIAVLRNTSVPGALSFANQLSVTCGGGGTQNVEIADFDNDGRPDMAAATFGSAKMIAVVRNTSSPGYLSFGSPQNFLSGDIPVQLAAGDIDGDGKNDIISYNYNSGATTNFSAFRNTTTGTNISFAPKADVLVTGSSVQSRTIRLADYDDDGKLDVVIMNDNNFSIYRNISTVGAIAFAAPIVQVRSQAQGSWIANLSGDKKPDLLLGNWNDRFFSMVRNLSTPGNIANDPIIDVADLYPNNILPYYTNSADFNLDGKTDIISSGSNDKKISILKNAMNIPVVFSGTYFCAGMTRTHNADISGSNYQWQENRGAGFANITNGGIYSDAQTATLTVSSVPYTYNGYTYRCVVNGNRYSTISEMRINPPTDPTISISTPLTTVCYGSSVQFTAAATGTGPATSYSWQVNGVFISGENGPTFTTSTLTNGSTVRGYIGNFCAPSGGAFSNIVTMTVAGQPATVAITTAQTSVCAGASVTFNSTVTNAGTNPVYQWQVNTVNVGNNSPTFTTTTLTNGAQVSLIVTTAATSCGTNPPVTSNIITLTINNPVAPTVNISTNTPSICQGANAFFGASYTSGGNNPTFQWQVNNVNAGTGNSFTSSTLANGDLIKAIMTSNGTCITTTTATSNTVTMLVSPVIIPTIIISGATIVNAGQPSVISTSTTNGGSSSFYVWQDSTSTHGWQNIINQIATTINYTPLQTGDKIRCVFTSNAFCAVPNSVTSNALQFSINVITAVNPVPVSSYGIVYFPNPVQNNLYVDSLRIADKWLTLEIIDLNGKISMSVLNISGKTTIAIPVQILVAGTYVAILRNKKGEAAYLRFIKL